MATITFKKISAGNFEVLENGQNTGYGIVNGSAGLSGHDTANMYGITRQHGSVNVKWVGTLQAAKKMVTFWLSTKAQA
jgi:hypothetical protein